MNKIVLFFAAALVLQSASLSAQSGCDCPCWRPVAGVEIGAVFSSHAGKSKTFPGNGSTDEFYHYSSHHKNQTRALYSVFAGAQWRALCDWDLQIDLKYSQSASYNAHGILTQGIDVQSQNSYNYKYKIALRQLLIEAKFSYVNCTLFRPYVSVGLGSSFNRAYSFSTNVPNSLTFTRNYNSHTTSGFTYSVGFGVDVEILDCVYAGLGYRFTDFGKASLGRGSIDAIPVSGTLSQHNFYANQLYAQLTFLF